MVNFHRVRHKFLACKRYLGMQLYTVNDHLLYGWRRIKYAWLYQNATLRLGRQSKVYSRVQ